MEKTQLKLGDVFITVSHLYLFVKCFSHSRSPFFFAAAASKPLLATLRRKIPSTFRVVTATQAIYF